MPQVGMYDYVPDMRIPVLDLNVQLREAADIRLGLLKLRTELPSCLLCRDTGRYKGKTCTCSK